MGGASVTGYRVSKDGGSSWTTVSNGLIHIFSDLANGTSYDFAVQAYNSKGWSNSATKTATAVRTVKFTDSNTSLIVVRKSNEACTFTASGSGAITYSLEGTIPAGVAINVATGELTIDGSIAPAGTYSLYYGILEKGTYSNNRRTAQNWILIFIMLIKRQPTIERISPLLILC